MTDKIAQWLRGIPGLEQLTEEWVDGDTGCAGLFLESRQTVEATADILGNTLRRQRFCWKLVTNRASAPKIPLETAPVLGLLQQVSLGRDRLVKLDQNQIPVWETELTVEFSKME